MREDLPEACGRSFCFWPGAMTPKIQVKRTREERLAAWARLGRDPVHDALQKTNHRSQGQVARRAREARDMTRPYPTFKDAAAARAHPAVDSPQEVDREALVWRLKEKLGRT